MRSSSPPTPAAVFSRLRPRSDSAQSLKVGCHDDATRRDTGVQHAAVNFCIALQNFG